MWLLLSCALFAALLLTYRYTLPLLLRRLLKKTRFKMEMSGFGRIQSMSWDSRVQVNPIWEHVFAHVTGLRLLWVKGKLVVHLQELRCRVVYNCVDIDYERFNMIGVDKRDMGLAIHGNLLKILRFYEADKLKFSAAVQKKSTKTDSSLDKLKKKLSLPQVLKQYLLNAATIAFIRLVEIRLDRCELDFEKRPDGPCDFSLDPRLCRYNAYFYPEDRPLSMKMTFEGMNVTMEQGPVRSAHPERQLAHHGQRREDRAAVLHGRTEDLPDRAGQEVHVHPRQAAGPQRDLRVHPVHVGD